tara:strand:- start:2113 stop:3003 length:891 start_codon:yes stop_codon:yes gene_type:complete
MKETKIVELVIADDSEELAIDAISLVNSPAIEQDFVFFGKEKNNLTFAKVDEEKRMLVSPALIPNKQIFRYDPNTDSEYYVFFSKATVARAAELYLKHNNHHKATYEHQDRVSGVLTVESWIKEGDNDKSKMYGYDLPNGTWFVKMKIENDDLWNKIKDGTLKGLSIEGYFANKFEQMNKKEFTTEEIRTALKELLSVQKVELALIDDINKPLDKAMSDFGNIEVGLFKAEETAVAAVGNYEKAARVAAEGVKRVKELGVSSDIQNLFKTRLNEAEMGAKDASNIAKQIQKIISQL